MKYLTISNPIYLYLVAFFLVFPALLINLGEMPLLADEPTRALVALEMYLSDNYIVPTINGEYYYNKPPLYNWLLVGLYHMTGRMDEWIVRIPTIGSIVIFGGIIFMFVRKYVDTKTAVFTVLAYITCGRVLFYDSLLGLIDTLFSALIFLNFMVVYHFDKKKEYAKMFIVSYLIITTAYFLKGLPALVFETITLITLAFLRKKITILFSKFHFLGIGIFLLFLILYYSQYLHYNSIETLLKTLVNESTKRTVVEQGLVTSLLHLVSFPIENILHFVPWTIPLLLLIKKENRTYILSNDFLRYNLVMLLSNILVYWFSPETKPRYLFMFLPSLFMIGYALYRYSSNYLFRKIMENILFVITIVLAAVCLAIPFVSEIPIVDYKIVKTAFLFIALLLIAFYYFKNAEQRLLLFCTALLIVRIGFDWFVFPARLTTEPEIAYKNNAMKVGQITKGTPLYLYKSTAVNHDISFYIERERKKILTHNFENLQVGSFYLTDVIEGELAKGTVYHKFRIAYNDNLVYLIKIEK